jgi:hypothetical protein
MLILVVVLVSGDGCCVGAGVVWTKSLLLGDRSVGARSVARCLLPSRSGCCS